MLIWMTAQSRADRLAQGDWEYLQQGWNFSGGDLIPAWSFIAVAVIFVVGFAGLWIWRRSHLGELWSQPILLFHRLAKESGVSLAQQWLMIRIAHHQRLTTPLTLMLSPATWRHHASGYLNAVGQRRRGPTKARYAQIERQLFGLSGSDELTPAQDAPDDR